MFFIYQMHLQATSQACATVLERVQLYLVTIKVYSRFTNYPVQTPNVCVPDSYI